MSSNQYLIDAASRHAVFIQRYSDGVGRIASSRVEDIARVLLGRVAENDVSEMTQNQFLDLRYNLDRQGQELYQEFEEELLTIIKEFAEQEADFNVELLERATSATTIQTADMDIIGQLIDQKPIDVEPGRSISIRQAIQEYGRAKVAQIDQLVRDAYTEGLTQAQQVAKVRAIIPLQRSQAAALVRTANNASATIAAFKTFEANADILEGYKWVSTLDMHTTFICMSRDNKVYPFSVTSPTPPAHWGCRSVIVPKVNARYDLGADISGIRPSASGEVSARVTYGGWLRKQPKSFVQSALGKARAELFLSGKLNIEDFVDPTGRVYTLAQLRQTNGLALEQ